MAAISGFYYLMGKRPEAFAFQGLGATTAVRLTYFEYVEFIAFWGDCNGVLRLTAEACDDQQGTNGIEIPFVYRQIQSGVPTQYEVVGTAAGGSLQEATELTTEQRSDLGYLIVVSSDRLWRSGKAYVRLKSEEQVSGQIIGGILMRMSYGRYSN